MGARAGRFCWRQPHQILRGLFEHAETIPVFVIAGPTDGVFWDSVRPPLAVFHLCLLGLAARAARDQCGAWRRAKGERPRNNRGAIPFSLRRITGGVSEFFIADTVGERAAVFTGSLGDNLATVDAGFRRRDGIFWWQDHRCTALNLSNDADFRSPASS